MANQAHIARLAARVICLGRAELPVAERVRLTHGCLHPALASAVCAEVTRIETERAASVDDETANFNLARG